MDKARVYYLRKATNAAFEKMQAAAQAEGVLLRIISASRNFDDQKAIWERKWKSLSHLNSAQERALTILEYSSMPGTSRHHWGTDMDLNALDNAYFDSGEGKKTYDWLLKNAHRFGFYQPYTPLNISRPTGYKEEKWHWSYLPIAHQMLSEYRQRVRLRDLGGFVGAETSRTLDVINRYVLGINPSCLTYTP